MRTVIGRLRDADRKRIEFGAHDTIGRVAARLVEMAERFGQPTPDGLKIALPFSQDELAGWIGASREAVSKALRRAACGGHHQDQPDVGDRPRPRRTERPCSIAEGHPCFDPCNYAHTRLLIFRTSHGPPSLCDRCIEASTSCLGAFSPTREVPVRKLTVGLLSLTLASGMGVFVGGGAAFAVPAAGGPSVADAASPSDELPNPLEEKRRESREVAISQILSGQATPEKRGASTVVKIGQKGQTGKGGDTKTKKARRRPVRRARAARRPTRSSSSSPSSATSGTRATPTRTPTRTRPGRPRSTARCTTRSPSRTARSTTPPIWQADYNQAHYQNLYFGDRQRRRVAEDVLRAASPRAATASTARSPTGSRSRTTRRATAAATASRAAATSAATPGT